MGECILYGNGGGGSSINFKVVGGTTEPTNPTENTIWVNTNVTITDWYFSATQPENMTEGEVWFYTGTTSVVAFNSLKKQNIMVYPLSAKQVVSGSLVDVTAKSYQGGAWVDWVQFLVSDGTAEITMIQARTDKSATIAQHDGYISITGLAETSLAVSFEEKVYLKGRRRIVLDADIIRAGSSATNATFQGVSVIVFDELPVSSANALYSGVVAYSITKTTGRQEITLDLGSISLDAKEYYIGIGLGYASNTGNSLNVYNFYVE